MRHEPEQLPREIQAHRRRHLYGIPQRSPDYASLQYLRDTDDKIIAVAERVGIGDISYFNKLFKHYIGVTPREYRLKYRQAAQKGKERSVRALGGTMEAAAHADAAVSASAPTA
nr:AraC family transcriptional regulator [Paenibacillus ginsengihumi]